MAVSLDDVFSVQVFFIVLRETIELAIIISVLLAFIQKTFLSEDPKPNEEDKKYVSSLKVQIWVGGLAGFAACLLVGAVILFVFYALGKDLWASTEHYWEGIFSIVASVIISAMGIKILRVNQLQRKWKHKLGSVISKSAVPTKNSPGRSMSEKYSMFILPFITTLREGLEAIVFIGGIGINENTTVWSIVNSAVLAIVIGSSCGVVLYKSGNTISLQWFLIISLCFLYLVAGGLFSKGVWNFELQKFIDKCGGMDVSETGDGPGSYDIMHSVWHVNCCNGERPEDGVFWMLATAIFGWTNSATYASVGSYLVYWIVIALVFNCLLYEDKYGKLPLIPVEWQKKRIRKRSYFLIDNSNNRQSTDTVDSRTPLTEEPSQP